MHRQIPVKVNALVDEGVAPLVHALSAKGGIVTLDSCEGETDHRAHVFFTYGSEWSQLSELAARIAATLRENRIDDYSVSIEWFGSSERPRALLRVAKGRVADAATALDQLRP